MNDDARFEKARQARDPRFDGRFFVGVKTTGIYCRPVCPVKLPKPRNVRFFPTAAAAAEAGFRPCLRCRPESAPGTPAWSGTSATVSRGLRLIHEGALDDGDVETLAERLGVTGRHLRRLFLRHVGATPNAVAQTRRLHAAKRLLDSTGLPVTDVALAAGYGSVRRFNAHFRSVYGDSPSSLRRRGSAGAAGEAWSLELRYRPPFDFDAVLAFLAMRGTPGVEHVDGESWTRSICFDDERGWIRVTAKPDAHALDVSVCLPSSRYLTRALERVRIVFDLNADPLEIDGTLRADPALAPLVKRHPGRRIPAAWDPFEIAVRAVVGQQVSVKGATTIMGRIAREFGEMVDGRLFFPTPECLSGLDPSTLPMPKARARALAELSRRIAVGDIDFASPTLEASLCEIKGIGPWTSRYIAMRATGDPDTLLTTDLVLRRVAEEHLGIASEGELLARAEAWRPWRAYAGVHLWSLAGSAPAPGRATTESVKRK